MTFEAPPTGTKCEDCKCCLAVIYAGDVPVCWDCDLGQPCKGKKLSPPPTVMARVERAGEAVEQHSLKTGEALGRAAAATRKAEARASTKGTLISDALKVKILVADTAISHRQLARQLGTSDVTVRKVRLAAGVGTPATKYNPRKAAAMPNMKDETGLRERFDRDEPQALDTPTRPDWMMDCDTPAESHTIAVLDSAGAPIGDHYAAVIADLEQKAICLQNDLEFIVGALPVLRAMRLRISPLTAPQPASQETAHV